MAWARLDDGFGDHPKVLDVIDSLPELEGAAAIGLWTLALTYAHSTMRTAKVPGFIPRSFARSRARVPAYLGDRLVEVGLWEAREGGWFIHDYTDYLPSEDLKSKRAEAGRRGAEARWGKNAAKPVSNDSDGEASGVETRPAPGWAAEETSDKASKGRDETKTGGEPAGADGKLPSFANGKTPVATDLPFEPHAESDSGGVPKAPKTALPNGSDDSPNVTGRQKAQEPMATCHDADGKKCPEPEPDAIPEPEQQVKTSPSSASPPSGRGGATVPGQRKPTEPDRFDEFWAVYPRKVAVGDARKAFAKTVKSGVSADELIAAAVRFGDFCRRTGRPKDKTRYAATWINGESWRDDLDDEEAPTPHPANGHQTYRDPAQSEYYDPKAGPR
jgi:hypothetical protein